VFGILNIKKMSNQNAYLRERNAIRYGFALGFILAMAICGAVLTFSLIAQSYGL
jgi:hypothetical protein